MNARQKAKRYKKLYTDLYNQYCNPKYDNGLDNDNYDIITLRRARIFDKDMLTVRGYDSRNAIMKVLANDFMDDIENLMDIKSYDDEISHEYTVKATLKLLKRKKGERTYYGNRL